MRDYVIFFAAGLVCGIFATHNVYSTRAAEAKADQLAITAAAQAAIMEEQKNGQKRLAEAIADRDRALADLAGLRAAGAATADRLRRADAPAGSRAGNSCDAYRKPLLECRKLLAESIDLAVEGAGLASELSADRDAVAKALKRK